MGSSSYFYPEGEGYALILGNYTFEDPSFASNFQEEGIIADCENITKICGMYNCKRHTEKNASHGEEGYFHCTDGKYSIKNMLELFNAKHCPNLIEKPKIFIIDACQGTSVDYGMYKESPDKRNTEIIPIWQDFLIIYGAFPGQRGRFFKSGSRFTTSFCTILSGPASNSLDLISLLTLVNRHVSQMGDSDKQSSHYQSTLIRFLQLKKKKETAGKPTRRFEEDGVDTPMQVDDGQLLTIEKAISMDDQTDGGASEKLPNILQKIGDAKQAESPTDPHVLANCIFDHLNVTLQYTTEEILQCGQVLRNHCIRNVHKQLTVENVFHFYQLAIEGSCAAQEEKTIEEFIKNNYDKLEKPLEDFLKKNIHVPSKKPVIKKLHNLKWAITNQNEKSKN